MTVATLFRKAQPAPSTFLKSKDPGYPLLTQDIFLAPARSKSLGDTDSASYTNIAAAASSSTVHVLQT